MPKRVKTGRKGRNISEANTVSELTPWTPSYLP